MEYNFNTIEKKWQKIWEEKEQYKVSLDQNKPKFYILDMFPYPSGAGLHVGHPLGYIASDIFARYKRHSGFNVLHPMGFDAYGLPAEQYAIQTGTHPAKTTEKNIERYKKQLRSIGFCYDWNREVQTCDPYYYKWTQWIFLKLFNSWYNTDTDKAENIEDLISVFKENGNQKVNASCKHTETFNSEQWGGMSEKEQQTILLNYRLAYLAHGDVNWCPSLGTVLANDEIKDGLSVRGGHPVIRKSMKQWFLRITAYSERLLQELDNLDWTDSMKEIQRNWIGRSEGGLMHFDLSPQSSEKLQKKSAEELPSINIPFFTTRPDTIFGATFMVLAPEHDLVEQITTEDNLESVKEYIGYAKSRSDRERQTEVKKISGAFTGSYAYNPFTKEDVPIWISEYVLMGYGTGAIMAVPAHDSRDYAFAKHFDLKILQVIEGGDIASESYDDPQGKVINSGFITGLSVNEAIESIIDKCVELGIGEKKVNFKQRDAAFSRQRYWGEPFPIYYKDDIPYAMDESELPLELPDVDSYEPSETGEAPLSKVADWKTKEGHAIESDTMPGYAGSSWYFLRYMDPRNGDEFVSNDAQKYWEKVDLYMGGAEHATGHLLYARFWTHFLFDHGYINIKEPFQKMINQGMITSFSYSTYYHPDKKIAISADLIEGLLSDSNQAQQPKELQELGISVEELIQTPVDINLIANGFLDIEKFKSWNKNFTSFEFMKNDKGQFTCFGANEKMSKSKFNVVNPDDIIEKFGADTFRVYEMFLGPIDQHKPWDTQGIDGSFRFLNRFWRLFFNRDGQIEVNDDSPTEQEYKILHKTIKKVVSDIEKMSFNTAISAFMVCTTELIALQCNKRAILEPLVTLIAPFAPHLAEELWELLGHKESVTITKYPSHDDAYLKEDSFTYPVAINGKTRAKVELSLDLEESEIEKEVLALEGVRKYLGDNPPKKVIIVPGRMINVVL